MNHKYIRVNNKIYKVKDYFMLPLDYPKFSVYGSNEIFYEAKVEGADKIEDLCDEFLVADGKEKTPKLINREGMEVEYVEWVCLPKEKYFDGIHAVVYDESEIYHLQDCYGEVLHVFRCDSGAKALEIAKGWLEEHGKTN